MAGTTYATTAQLATYLGTTGETLDAARLLKRATEVIQEATLDRVAIPDDPALVPVTPASPTDTETLQIACREAACAQVEYWLETGEDADLRPNVQNYGRGKSSTTFGNGGLPALAPRARRKLFLAGALYCGGTLT